MNLKKELQCLQSALPHFHSGKVRETFGIPGYPDLLLVFVTDRISTHNVVHTSNIPHKGEVLTALTIFWLRDVFSDMAHHLVASGREIYQYLPNEMSGLSDVKDTLHRRAIIVRKLEMTKVEFIYRSYLVGAGSLYKAYCADQDPYGISLPSGLPIMHRFEKPIFTPTDKSETDDPIASDMVLNQFPDACDVSKSLFMRGSERFARHEIVLLDSKYEVGERTIADEVNTFDSSRLANTEEVELAIVEERDPAWLDKQIVRDEAEMQWKAIGKKGVPLCFSTEVVDATAQASKSILSRLSGKTLEQWRHKDFFDFHI